MPPPPAPGLAPHGAGQALRCSPARVPARPTVGSGPLPGPARRAPGKEAPHADHHDPRGAAGLVGRHLDKAVGVAGVEGAAAQAAQQQIVVHGGGPSQPPCQPTGRRPRAGGTRSPAGLSPRRLAVPELAGIDVDPHGPGVAPAAAGHPAAAAPAVRIRGAQRILDGVQEAIATRVGRRAVLPRSARQGSPNGRAPSDTCGDQAPTAPDPPLRGCGWHGCCVPTCGSGAVGA